MPLLADLLADVPLRETLGPSDREVSTLQLDSRRVGGGDVFVAVRGTATDGHRYIGKAIAQGAVAIVCEELPDERPEEVTLLKVTDSASALATMAANYYGHPSRELHLVGVTGTNGKTTTVTLLYDLFTELGYKTGLLSTVANRIGAQKLASTHTTPDAIAVQQLLRDMVDAGCNYAFMEVSSHAVAQQRIAGLHFTGAVFTNLSHDHLDYHETFRAYLEAKKAFFDQLPPSAWALTNVDDKNGPVMLQNTRARRLGYALRRPADYKAKIVESRLDGIQLQLDGHEFYGRLIGEFNAYNALAAYAVARELGVDATEVLTALSNLKAAEGRFDYIGHPTGEGIGIVDYAHTPDALEKVLQTILRLRQGEQPIITVVGCGGDRDRTKRPEMARIACTYSNDVILTNDNPRTENPETILDDMQAGVPPTHRNSVLRIADRRSAIQTATKLAGASGIVLIAGKGHEKYQEINGVKHAFDDKAELARAWA